MYLEDVQSWSRSLDAMFLGVLLPRCMTIFYHALSMSLVWSFLSAELSWCQREANDVELLLGNLRGRVEYVGATYERHFWKLLRHSGSTCVDARVKPMLRYVALIFGNLRGKLQYDGAALRYFLGHLESCWGNFRALMPVEGWAQAPSSSFI